MRTKRPTKRRSKPEEVEPVAVVRARLRQVRTRRDAEHLVAAYERLARAHVKDRRKRRSKEVGELMTISYFAAAKVKDDALMGRVFSATVPMWYSNALLFDRPPAETKMQKMRRHVQECRRRHRPGTWNFRICVWAALAWMLSCRWSNPDNN